jgi:hypothetical protein
MNRPTPANSNPVTIPKSPLGHQLAEAAAIKAAMTGLLRDLESRAAGSPVARPGRWRHHLQTWPESIDQIPQK